MPAVRNPDRKVTVPANGGTTKAGSAFIPANIKEHLIYSRAVEAVIWGAA